MTDIVATRRKFLQIAGCAAAAASAGPFALSSGAAAQGREPRVSPPVGYQIFGWSRTFPEAWWMGAAAVGALGFAGIEGEYTIGELYEGREAEFEDRMQRCGVRLSALYATSDLERIHEQYENRRKLMAAAAFARRMGCRMIVLGGTHAPHKSPELFAQFAKEANEIGQRLLETHGVRLGLHPHTGALVETREEIDRVMDATRPEAFFLSPDTGHLMAGGSEPVEVFRTYQERIVHAHLKDYRRPGAGDTRGSFVALGEGSIDFSAIVDIVTSRHFDGWLNVELDGARGLDPADVAREAREYVTGTLGLSLGVRDAA